MTLIIFASSPVFALGEQYAIEPKSITSVVRTGNFVDVPITITNNDRTAFNLALGVDGDAAGLLRLDKTSMIIDPGKKEQFTLTIFGENTTSAQGFVTISGTVSDAIPLNITVTDFLIDPVDALSIDIEPITQRAKIGDIFKYKIGLQNLLTDKKYNITISHSIDKLEKEGSYKFEKSFFTETQTVELSTSVSLVKEFDMPDFIRPGEYVINVKADFLGLSASASQRFSVVEDFWDMLVLGIIPVRWLILLGIIFVFGIAGFIIYKKKKAKGKRYVSKIDFNLLPKPGPRSVWIGYIAETNKKAYFDLDQLTTHTLVAGSTGGGKTVSVEVLVEEALMKGVSVIVFDPTAQWTGFLRKNTLKKMFDLYPKYGMKKSDARAYNGNIRQILNAREIIDIKKHVRPGEITVFSVNRLDPEDIDVLVANTVREVFHSNFGESPELKLLLVFDEVHRLLPKFGGSGEGFLQIERGAREFRKWGIGLVLISQVLTDFVGETKANINTEIQMRTRDPGDLDRIKNKYGDYMLQSLLKAATGTGMMENTSFNKGNPYFVAFRPLLHEHARLSDDELGNYNKYNDIIDDLEYQLEMLEKNGVDIFELKLELKLAADKVKTGNFNMVNVYLDGLKPMILKQWDKLGKAPEKRKLKLVSEAELREELAKAKEAREKFEKTQSSSGSAGSGGGGSGGGGIKVLSLSNGIMVTKKNELLDALEAMDDDTFKVHVTDSKNELADWLMGQDKNTAEIIAKIKTRAETIAALKKEWDVQ